QVDLWGVPVGGQDQVRNGVPVDIGPFGVRDHPRILQVIGQSLGDIHNTTVLLVLQEQVVRIDPIDGQNAPGTDKEVHIPNGVKVMWTYGRYVLKGGRQFMGGLLKVPTSIIEVEPCPIVALMVDVVASAAHHKIQVPVPIGIEEGGNHILMGLIGFKGLGPIWDEFSIPLVAVGGG